MSKLGFGLLASTFILTACGGEETGGEANSNDDTAAETRYELDATTPAWKLDTKEETTELTWYVNADWWNKDFGTDTVTKKIKEDLNIDIEFITGDDTKLNTLFAGGDMPDLITTFDPNSEIGKKANSWALSLNDLADQYDPHFYEVYAEETFNWFQLEDGKTYGYPNYSNTQEDYNSGMIPTTTAFVIRKDIYDALGQPEFNTPEKFLESLDKITTEYPELHALGFNEVGTGTGPLGNTLQDYLGVPLETEDGDFYNRNLDEDYLLWVETLNEAYRNGAISDDSFADDSTGFAEKTKTGKYATMILDGTVQQSGNLQIWSNSNPDGVYIAVDGPASTVGNEITLNQSGISGWMTTYVTKQISDPAKAIQIFTYLLSEEGQLLVNYGIEGETYTKDEDGLITFTEEIKEMQQSDADRFKKEHRMGEFIFFAHDKHKVLSSDSFQPAIHQMMEWGEGKLYPHFILENTAPDQGTQEARSLTNIETQWANSLISMVRAGNETEFDAALETYKTFLDENNWESIVEIRSGKIAENKEKLGIE
ncbi:sugar ABC transporter substrate-binding protein [Jeotgalibaca caeni]|uniref:sugar ABC transporter substrate-binding protein n=1 Tax=Jeotgalibaca caeni TaxID=3028623 RepID=UPI00237D879F|nr:sugar ABC transporter substrate-binding protein [Jeotgalibaca caeni]MDE1549696.1 sugar ABC transporter substrate-binding protein [Jeotgalibaca caeni]